MKFSKIVGFGDSWMFGDELLDSEYAKTNNLANSADTQNIPYRESHCFLGLLGKHYNVPTENFGIPGGSLQSTIWTFLKWFTTAESPQDALILIGLTEADRFSLWDPNAINEKRRMIHSTWAEIGATEVPVEFRPLFKQHIALTTCDQLRELNYYQTALMFDGVASRNNLKLLQFNVAASPINLSNVPTLLEQEFSLTRWFVQEIQADHGRKYIHPYGHPNEIGHILIRDRLILQIDSCTLYEC
jgi:hypothetical protein